MKKSLLEMNFNFFDTETTGDNKTGKDKPIELAVISYNLLTGLKKPPFSTLINPQMPIHPSAIPIHGITDNLVENEKSYEEILPSFLDYIGEDVLVAHNIDFDLAMVPDLVERPNDKLDSLNVVRAAWTIGDLGYKEQDLRSHKIQELRYWLNLDIDIEKYPAHRALSDIIVTAEVFKHAVLKIMKKNNIEYYEDLITFINTPVLKEKMTMGKYLDVDIREAIDLETKNNGNYFGWLLYEIECKKMKLDKDLLYSINYFLKEKNINPSDLISKQKNKSRK